MSSLETPAYEFGPFRLEARERRLLRDGRPVPLRAKVFETLLHLVERHGRLVEKRELLEAVWPDAVVEECNLAHNVSAVRKALGERDSGTPYVETVPKAGYRFVAPVRAVAEEPSTHGPQPVAAPEPASAAAAAPRRALHQEIRFCTAHDGVQIAYAVTGEGPPIVKVANWLNHLEFDWKSPIWRHLVEGLAHDHTLVRYDERGSGLSDWNAEDISFDAFVCDLEAVVDALRLERFSLLGISQGCAVSIAYAVRHPERVRRMVLHGGYAAGWYHRAGPEERAWRQALVTLSREGWGQDSPAFRQVFTSLYVPGATPEQMTWFNQLQRISASPENAVRLQEVLSRLDVRDLLGRVAVPTLVLHCQRDAVVPFSCGRELAGKIPGARFVPLDSDDHLVLEHEPAWPRFLEAVRSFLDEGD